MDTRNTKINITIIPKKQNNVISTILTGIPKNYAINFNTINEILLKNYDKKYVENYKIESGINNCITNGLKIVLSLEINSIRKIPQGVILPNSSLLGLLKKYLSYDDEIPYEEFMFLITIIGMICEQVLSNQSIKIYSHILSLKDIYDISFLDIASDKRDNIKFNQEFPVIDSRAKSLMRTLIKKVSLKQNTISGKIETLITNVPLGTGNVLFGSLKSKISSLLFCIDSLNGVEFGEGNNLNQKFGSEIVDEIEFKDDLLTYKTNHLGGIIGGLATGNDILIKTSFVPEVPIAKEFSSINIMTGDNIRISSTSSYETTTIHKKVLIINALTAVAILDSI